MDIPPRAAAAAAIQAAGLSPTTEQNARRLLGIASDDNGSVHTTYGAMRSLFGVKSDSTVRRHLGYMSSAGLLHYHSNEWIYVTWKAWPPVDEGHDIAHLDIKNRAPMREYRAPMRDGDENDAVPEDANRAPVRDICTPMREYRAPVREKNAYKELMFVCLFVDPTTNSLEEILDKQTNKQRSAYALLTDPEIAVAELLAADLAAGYELEDIQRQVFAWLRDMAAGRVRSAGALINRIRKGFSARLVSDEEKQSELWRRHFPAETTASRYFDGEYDELIIR